MTTCRFPEEGISSNILGNRLNLLLHEGVITKADDPSHKRKAIYSLVEKAIALVAVFARPGAWGRRYTPATEELSIRAPPLDDGGPLRRNGPTVAERLQAVYDDPRTRKTKREVA